jgi:hypothetical protein
MQSSERGALFGGCEGAHLERQPSRAEDVREHDRGIV